MNKGLLAIGQLGYTVDRPAIYSIIKQLQFATQISDKTNIVYMGEEGAAIQKGSAIDDQTKSNNIWPYNDKITIEVTEETDNNRLLSTMVSKPEQLFIFYDGKLGISMKPVYVPTEIVITFKYRASDKNAAETWRNEMNVKTSMNRDINLHVIGYSYTVPEDSLKVLAELHKLREEQGWYGEEFLKYFTDHLTTRGGTASNLNGQIADWVISERQSRIIGKFDFQGSVPKAEKVGDSSAYTITFDYRFSYEKPTHIFLTWPSLIHNQVVESNWRVQPLPPYWAEEANSFTQSGLSLKEFESDYQTTKAQGNKGISIPPFDSDFIGYSVPSGTARVFTALCTISPDDKQSLLNLKDLGDFVLHNSVIKYIEQHKEDVVKIYKSVINFSLYEDYNLMPNNILELDDDLNLYSTVELDIRKTYRVRMGLVVNLHFLNNSIMKQLREYGRTNRVFLYKLAATMCSVLKSIGGHPDIQASHLSKDDLKRLGIISAVFGDGIDKADEAYYDSEQVNFNLVENFFIETKSMTELNKPVDKKIRYRLISDYIQNAHLPNLVMLNVEYWLHQYTIE